MSYLATWQGKLRIGIDHAVAASQWADRTEDTRLRAYTADVAARAYAADGQRDACLTALDTAHTVLTMADDQTPSYRGLFSGLDRRLIVAAQDGSHKIDSAALNKPQDRTSPSHRICSSGG